MNQSNNRPQQSLVGSSAFAFVLMMGAVNLFADMTYEGGASINGPFLGSLGASAAAIGIVAGVGEFLGYAIRLPAGYLSDKTGRIWLLTFIGYVINLFAVPALALAGNWPVAAALVVTERVGRAIRKPTVESMLSYTTGRLGRGWVYGLNTALDEIGAMLGPLLIAVVLLLKGKGSYRVGYATLLISDPVGTGCTQHCTTGLSAARAIGIRSYCDRKRIHQILLALHASGRMLSRGSDELRTHFLSSIDNRCR